MQEFDNREFETYKAEVQERWGKTDAYKEHAERTKSYSKDKWNSLISEMYVADDRFKNNIDKHGSGTAAFISEAITIYSKKQ